MKEYLTIVFEDRTFNNTMKEYLTIVFEDSINRSLDIGSGGWY